MIIVTGATGQLGRIIVQQLVKRVSPDQIGVSVRNPSKAADLTALGVRVRQGDFSDPASLPHAFEGVTQLLLVSSNARAQGGDPLAQHAAVIDAARTAGARRIVYTSQISTSPTSAFGPGVDHAATEKLLSESGQAWTSLRNGFYASTALGMMSKAFETGVMATPVDGKIAWTAHADLGEGAAVILVNEGQYDGPTPPLTGSQALDFTDLTAIASDILGRSIRHETFPDDELAAKMGIPAGAARFSLGLYVASRANEFGPANPALEQLLGRAPITMRELMAQTLNR
ncbi:NAD(P)H-binding protein [Deinococcus rubellus]|uniref:SDR family oxidoreductase n=1 Tax=Deinococcus rubellus TaxID=1889240 RepID=A0ABY5YKC6_9DEIO|nr:SDR family oxidoreductase [Deinococcus rubellus]UWX64223.1 SDR family oxidoreductase [Deinococcus rubellus]